MTNRGGSVSGALRTAAAVSVAAVLLLAPSPAQRAEPLPEELQGVGITEHLDETLPLEALFVDDEGRDVALSDYFDGERPVLMTVGYYRCPMLCNLVLNGAVEALRELPWTAGDEFELVTVSISPAESPGLAKFKKQNYLAAYGRRPAERGWHFLTGPQASIDALTEALGFGYRALANGREFAHPAVIFVITPDGRVARYLYGVKHDPETLRLSLVEASDGKVGTTIDRVMLFCFHYDAAAGAYAPAAMNLMRAGGALTVLVLAAGLAILWRRDARRTRAANEGAAA